MKALINKYWKISLSVVFGFAVFLFWVFPYVSALSYQEQYQMFLFDTDYFLSRIFLPGGLSDYIAEFLIQFNYIPIIGAAILSLLYVLLQRIIWLLAKKNGAEDVWYPLSFLPSVLLWLYMGDENVMLSFVVSLVIASWCILFYNKISKDTAFPDCKWRKALYLFLLIPVFYWLFGSNVFIIVLYVILYELKKGHSLGVIGFCVCFCIYVLALVLISSIFLQYPLYRLFGGLNYYRYPAFIPVMQFVVMFVVAVLPIVLMWMPNVKKKRSVTCGIILMMAVGSFYFVKSGFDTLKYDLIDYDYLVRTQQWGKIIEKAETRQASTPMGVSCVNLALAETGQLSDHIFEFYQNGGEGLIPSFARDMTSPLSTAEIFYHLGMINDAQRYMFEAQEAIPNFRKSGRCTKRLAETNLINGQYDVATKYLRMLQKTIFYSKWADKTMKLLVNEKAINTDPEYGKLRSFRYKKKDYLFSDREIDQMLGLLYVGNYKNSMAFEYLMCYELLQGNLFFFEKYYPLGRFANFNHIPRAYQEALIYKWSTTHPDFNGMPWSIDQQTCQNMITFAKTYMANPNDPNLKDGILGNTLWSYLLVKKDKKDKTKVTSKQIY